MSSRSNPITYGEQLKSCEVGGFILTETLHSPHLTLRRHEHESANLNFVLKGYFREIISNRPYECKPSSLLIKPAGEAHSNQYGRAEVRCLAIEVTSQRLESIRLFSKLFDDPAHYSGGLLSTLALQIYREFRNVDSASTLVIEGLVLELLGYVSRHNSGVASVDQPRWLREAREIVHEHFTEQLSSFSIAAAVGVHPAHLARVFRKHYGCSVGEYVRRLRLDYAARELSTSVKPLAEIAVQAGFFDQSHFTHAFKLHMKMTPSEFRAAFLKSNTHTKMLDFSKTR